MLKIESNGGVVDARIEGTVKVITADLCVAINSIYEKLKGDCDGTEKLFRVLLSTAILSGVVFEDNSDSEN